ncbi:MAG: hypothetical protein QOH56_4352 [Pseudonocardiales bacterium]|jgi:hypothetical protein|nr:hypothetical protein [Pseudonocardiales bacterium]
MDQLIWVERFLPKVETQPDGCHLWQAASRGGYGLFWLDGKTQQAHRLAYEHLVQEIPLELQLDHLCRTRLCVNVEHLEPVTHAENVRRGTVGENNRRKTHCSHGHEFAQANTYVDKLGRRHCRKCDVLAHPRRRIAA